MNLVARKILPLLFVLPCLTGCVSGPAARTGTALGGLSGALLGAAAGMNTGKALEGAAIGGLAGSAVGGALGNAVDEDRDQQEARQAAYEEEIRARAITLDQVINMSRSGLGDQVIANQIRTQGVVSPLGTSELILLKQNGVSDNVLAAWQEQSAVPTTMVVPPARPPVIVQEHWVEPAWYPGPFWCHPRHHRHCGPTAGIHVRF